ncbi:MAG: hypothetical protein JST61_01170 [Acidobacteria bacterium]|nr:hypothetical protein [Acidobacteriota bacterium]
MNLPFTYRPGLLISRIVLYLVYADLALAGTVMQAQSAGADAPALTPETQLNNIATQLAAAQAKLQESQHEIDRLQQQLSAVRAQLAATSPVSKTPAAETAAAPPSDLQERVDVLESQVAQHDQSKVESASKYPVRLTGLVLFNAFTNSGTVDDFDLPSVATAPAADAATRSSGASLRQTIVGISAIGPHLLGASSQAEVNFDFYGGIPYNSYGTSGGLVRLRTGSARLSWQRDTAEVGLVEPLISPLSPTSYATVAEPAMAWAGNLWTWAPQLSYKHLFAGPRDGGFGWQFGLWDPPAAGYNNPDIYRAPSSGERSAQPAYETRFSYTHGEPGSPAYLQLGTSGYYSRQSYTGRSGDSWAVTGDWKLPLSRFVELSGEAYRGRALGGLGGGVYKDVVSGTDPVTGRTTFRLLNDVGGWSQVKVRFTRLLEANGTFGQDNGFARDFHSLILPSTAGTVQLRARNQAISANLIYTPRTYLIVSPEYRRIRTSPINSAASVANIFTLSFGYRF